MTEQSRLKIYSIIKDFTSKHHFNPIDGLVNTKHFPVNPFFLEATYVFGRNALLVGDPSWGKTTSAKIMAARNSGIPYDTYDALEIRGNPHAYEEKIVGRFDFSKLIREGEHVIWKGSFALPVLMVDEANWLPPESQAAILQGIETGRWNYGNETCYEGKKPTFLAINKKVEGSGFIDALDDRMDICLVFEPISSIDMLSLRKAKKAREQDLNDPAYTDKALENLSKNFESFKKYLARKPLEGRLTDEEIAGVRETVEGLKWDDDAKFFLQSFYSEVNFNNQYGVKRMEDPPSTETHDVNHIGVHFGKSFSSRASMAAQEYASFLAWFLGENKVTKDHVVFVLPYLIHHKAEFSSDYKNAKANDQRKHSETLHLAHDTVKQAEATYTTSVTKFKNLIGKMQRKEMSIKEIGRLNEDDYDHPLMKDLIRKVKEPKVFYE